jgi:cytoskeletal protein CcmA (bactofilin family)
MDAPKTGEFAHIGKSVVIKGELSGSEDLYVDGQVEGSIELRGNSLTVGPNGKIKARVSAKNIVILGSVEGTVTATERVELRKSAVVNGDIATARIAVEEGAFFKGKIDIQKEGRAAAPAAS